MAELSELSASLRLFLRAYRWRRIDPVPWQVPARPLGASRVALVSSAGLVAADSEPFDARVRGGDPSFRMIPGDTRLEDLVESHRSQSFDHSGLAEDPALALPVPHLRALAETGRIGRVNHRHVSVMGSITAPGRMTKQTAPAIAAMLAADEVDVALLVPV